MQGRRARGGILALLGEVRAVLLGQGENRDEHEHDDGKGGGKGRFLVIGTLNETLLGLMGGEEVWGLKGEEVLTRGGYSERAWAWLERERERLKREGRERGEEGVVAGVSVAYMKWIIVPETATPLLPASAAAGKDVTIIPASVSGTTDGGITIDDDDDGGGREGHNNNDNTNNNKNNGGGIIMIHNGTDSTSTQTPSTSTSTSTHTHRPKNPPLLPKGGNYHFSKARREEFQTVIRSTAIPRTEETLAQLGNVSVRYRRPPSLPPSSPPSPATASPTAIITNPTAVEGDTTKNKQAPTSDAEQEGELVAWAFLSHDGSLSSLHVTPAHRGQGLAKAITRKLMQELVQDPLGMGFHARLGGDDDDDGAVRGWVSADVAVGNEESKGVVRGVGGKEGWRVRWVSVDLGRVG